MAGVVERFRRLCNLKGLLSHLPTCNLHGHFPRRRVVSAMSFTSNRATAWAYTGTS
jgi:hypothetical protein